MILSTFSVLLQMTMMCREGGHYKQEPCLMILLVVVSVVVASMLFNSMPMKYVSILTTCALCIQMNPGTIIFG